METNAWFPLKQRNVLEDINNNSLNIKQKPKEASTSEDCKGNIYSSGAGPRQSILNLKENKDNSDLYFDITRGGGLDFSVEAENGLNSLTNHTEESEEKLVKVKVEETVYDQDFGKGVAFGKSQSIYNQNKCILLPTYTNVDLENHSYNRSSSSPTVSKVKCEECGKAFPCCKCTYIDDQVTYIDISQEKISIEMSKEKSIVQTN